MDWCTVTLVAGYESHFAMLISELNTLQLKDMKSYKTQAKILRGTQHNDME